MRRLKEKLGQKSRPIFGLYTLVKIRGRMDEVYDVKFQAQPIGGPNVWYTSDEGVTHLTMAGGT